MFHLTYANVLKPSTHSNMYTKVIGSFVVKLMSQDFKRIKKITFKPWIFNNFSSLVVVSMLHYICFAE